MKNTFINKYYKNEYKELIKTLNNDAKTFTAGTYINLNSVLDDIYKRLYNHNVYIKGVLNRFNGLSICFEVNDGKTTKYYTVNAGKCRTRTFKEYLYDIKTYDEFFNEQIELTPKQLIKTINYNIKYKLYKDCLENEKKEEIIW